MTASRRLINLAGTLLVVIALVAGTMLTALPIYLESRDLNAQEQDVAASNQLLQTQIDALRAKEAELPQVEQDLAELHAQFPSIPQLDDATQLVVKAAGKVNAGIESVQFGGFAPFAPRDATLLTDQLPQTATGVTPTAEQNGQGTNGQGTNSNGVGDAAVPDASPANADTVSDSAPSAPGMDGKLQFPVTVTVIAPDQAAANRFLDELRVGPRLLRIDAVNADTNEDDSLKLTVTGFVFVSLS
jgi:type II secretory pathway pseudopilin PulG